MDTWEPATFYIYTAPVKIKDCMWIIILQICGETVYLNVAGTLLVTIRGFQLIRSTEQPTREQLNVVIRKIRYNTNCEKADLFQIQVLLIFAS